MEFVRWLGGVTAPLARAGEFLAAVAMFAIMIIAMTDVTARYVFNAPLPWSFDLIMWFLMPMVFFFALGSTALRRDHVDIDVIYDKLPAGLQRALAAFGLLLSIAVYGLIVYLGFGRAAGALASGELMNGALEWPTWIYLAFVPLGFGLMVIVLVQQAIGVMCGGPLASPSGHDDTGAR